MSNSKTLILNKKQTEQRLLRIAWQICEDNYGEDEIVIVGIAPRGSMLAQRIIKHLNKIAPEINFTFGKIELDKDNPIDNAASITLDESDYEDKPVILVDDVLNSGKTLIYAVKLFLTVPIKSFKTVVLVDRSHKRFPVKADYKGMSLATTMKEHVSVELDGEEAVYLI